MVFNKGLKSVLLAPNSGKGEGGVAGSSNVWRDLGGSIVGCLDV